MEGASLLAVVAGCVRAIAAASFFVSASNSVFDREETHDRDARDILLLGCQIDATVTEPPAVSVVVPTRNEAANIEPLVDALTRSARGASVPR